HARINVFRIIRCVSQKHCISKFRLVDFGQEWFERLRCCERALVVCRKGHPFPPGRCSMENVLLSRKKRLAVSRVTKTPTPLARRVEVRRAPGCLTVSCRPAERGSIASMKTRAGSRTVASANAAGRFRLAPGPAIRQFRRRDICKTKKK